jgi:tRNA threonylcarbamoyl adenosine modification protein YjeE
VVRRTYALRDEEETVKVGGALAPLLRVGDLVFLEGDLGAGKTFLVRAIAHGLGVSPRVPVTSPTFGLIHEIAGPVPILHVDLYRLSRDREVADLGLGERLADVIAFVEWGERFQTVLGDPSLVIRLALSSDTSRTAVLEGSTARGRAILEQLAAVVA